MPKWLKVTPEPLTAVDIGVFGEKFLANKQAGKLGISGLKIDATGLGAIKPKVTSFSQFDKFKVGPAGGLNVLNNVHNLGVMKEHFLDGAGMAGVTSLGGGGQMMMSVPSDAISSATDLAIKLEDFGFNNPQDEETALVLKNAFLNNAVKTVNTEVKDEVTVSFDYLIIQINRPWLYRPLLENTNWYIPGARRGELNSGKEGEKFGVLSVVPDRVIIIRNLKIRGKFTAADRVAMGQSFAIGPFTLDRNVDIQEEMISQNGMHLLAYVDSTLPMTPPRSDPAFPV